MPGADGGGAFGGVSNLKLILSVEQGGGVAFLLWQEKKSEILQDIGLYSAVCCCSCAVLNFLAKLHPQLLAEFAPSVNLNPPVPDTCCTPV